MSNSTRSICATLIACSEYIGYWLISRHRSEVWGLLLVLTTIVAAVDFATYASRISLTALYIIPISIGCWTLKPRQAAIFTVSVALVSSLRYPLLNPDPDFFLTLNNHVGRLFSFGLNAPVLMALRRSHDRYAYLARHDMLTGCLNKSAVLDAMAELMRMAAGRSETVLLSYIDLDGFKVVNDRHGHASGDAVLKTFAREVTRALPETAVMGRLGGDEFLIACSIPFDGNVDLAASHIHQVASRALAGCPYAVSCSMGAVVVAEDNHSALDVLIAQADKAMYLAKRAGKDNFCLMPDQPFSAAKASEDQTMKDEPFLLIARAS
jgi:diguanylate cyclase (GGDEF)-like protein